MKFNLIFPTTYAIVYGLKNFFFFPFARRKLTIPEEIYAYMPRLISRYMQQTFAFIRSFYDVALRPAISTLLMKIHITCFAAMARFSISSFQPDTEEDRAKKNNTHLPRRIINGLS